MINLSILIVNWNTKDYLNQCLRSIKENVKGITYEIIVVDNNSDDGSDEMVRSKFFGVRLISNEANLGFAKANNQAYTFCKGRYLLLLNPDTIVLLGSLESIVNFLDSHLDAGAVTCKFLFPDKSFQRYYNRFPTIASAIFKWTLLVKVFPNSKFIQWYTYSLDEDKFDKVRTIEQPPAACLMIRKELTEKIGFMDEKFPILFNDVDLCRRIWGAGYRVYIQPQAEIIHYKGRGLKQGKSLSVEFYISLFNYFRKYHGWHAAYILKFVFCGDLLLRSILIFLAVCLKKKRCKDLLVEIKKLGRVLVNRRTVTY